MADPDSIREAAEEILRRPEYQEPTPSLVDRFLGWLGDRFADTLAALAGGVPGGYVVGWLLVAALVIGIAVMAWRVLPRRWVATLEQIEPPLVQASRRASRAEWMERAAAAEARGEWREATRARYRALVAGLIARAELDDSPGATTGEHRRELGGEAARRSAFDAATRRFEDVWYGGRPAEASDPGLLVALDQDLLDARKPSGRSGGERSRPVVRSPSSRSWPSPCSSWRWPPAAAEATVHRSTPIRRARWGRGRWSSCCRSSMSP